MQTLLQISPVRPISYTYPCWEHFLLQLHFFITQRLDSGNILGFNGKYGLCTYASSCALVRPLSFHSRTQVSILIRTLPCLVSCGLQFPVTMPSWSPSCSCSQRRSFKTPPSRLWRRPSEAVFRRWLLADSSCLPSSSPFRGMFSSLFPATRNH
jgi:hypothetical protein